ncbi:RNA polymerase sigma-70 factor [Sunxiuqinia sp. sy24]|uniref:RNA polymerase sigma-70 factor n=1 Tax=Sunxiuqinia sp. sy24 TaxID=3461495 RepID=UPI0040467EA2
METLLTYDIVELKSGSSSEFEKVYLDFYDVLYAMGKQYLMDACEAEEIVQEAFLKLWEVRVDLNDESNIRNFLYTMVKNNCLNQIRNKQNASRLLNNHHYQELQYNYEALEKSSDSFMQFQELKEKIDQAIAELPDDLRMVFEMNRFHDLRYKDIALQLGISEKTVEARMSKALKVLRTELKDYLPVVCLITKMFS